MNKRTDNFFLYILCFYLMSENINVNRFKRIVIIAAPQSFYPNKSYTMDNGAILKHTSTFIHFKSKIKCMLYEFEL